MHIIVYNAGSYGSFTGWTLEWLQGKYPVNHRPFTARHTSHNNDLIQFETVDEALISPISNSHVHPVRTESDNIIVQIKKVLSVYDKIVLLYPEPDDYLWNASNKFYKIGFYTKNQNIVQTRENAMSHWSGDDIWEQREWLSLWWYNQHNSEGGYEQIVNYNNDRVFKFPINQIRDNFVTSFQSIAKFLDLDVVRSVEEIEVLGKDWLNNEPYLYKDRLIKELVYATINNIDKEINDLSLLDEAEMQRLLRLEGYEIKCYGLNEWPKTTTQLRELIYETDV